MNIRDATLKPRDWIVARDKEGIIYFMECLDHILVGTCSDAEQPKIIWRITDDFCKENRVLLALRPFPNWIVAEMHEILFSLVKGTLRFTQLKDRIKLYDYTVYFITEVTQTNIEHILGKNIKEDTYA